MQLAAIGYYGIHTKRDFHMQGQYLCVQTVFKCVHVYINVCTQKLSIMAFSISKIL